MVKTIYKTIFVFAYYNKHINMNLNFVINNNDAQERKGRLA